MTKPVESVHTRLLALEREVRKQRQQFDEVLRLQGSNVLLAGTIHRLLGENDALRRNVEKLQQYIALKAAKAAA